MLEVKDNNLLIDKEIVPLKSVDFIKSIEYDFYLFNNGIYKHYPYSIKELYGILQKAVQQCFVFIKNTIINLDNVDYIWIKNCNSEKSPIINGWKNQYTNYALVFMFKTGKQEEICFETSKEAEKVYHKIETKLIDINDTKLVCN